MFIAHRIQAPVQVWGGKGRSKGDFVCPISFRAVSKLIPHHAAIAHFPFFLKFTYNLCHISNIPVLAAKGMLLLLMIHSNLFK